MWEQKRDKKPGGIIKIFVRRRTDSFFNGNAISAFPLKKEFKKLNISKSIKYF